jgi:hypothetical protein
MDKTALTRTTIPIKEKKGYMTLATLYSMYLSKGIVSVCEDGKVVYQGKEKRRISA